MKEESSSVNRVTVMRLFLLMEKMGVRRVAVINSLKNEWISEIVGGSYIYL